MLCISHLRDVSKNDQKKKTHTKIPEGKIGMQGIVEVIEGETIQLPNDLGVMLVCHQTPQHGAVVDVVEDDLYKKDKLVYY